MTTRWQDGQERGSPFLINTILWIALHLGRGTARIILYPITLYFLIAAPAARRISQDFLTRVFGRKASLLESARHFFCFASTILDRVFLMSGRFDEFDIKVHGLDMLKQQLARGKGVLLLGSHLGSFEVMRVLAVVQSGFQLKVLMYRDRSALISKLLESLNPEVARTVIPLGELNSMLKVHESLTAGEMVATLGDRVAGSDKIVKCRFLNEETFFPAGPMLLAATLQVPVVLIFGLHQGGNRYDIHIELLTGGFSVDRQKRDPEIQKWTQRYVDRLEYYAQQAPYNWFNFYDFWSADD